MPNDGDPAPTGRTWIPGQARDAQVCWPAPIISLYHLPEAQASGPDMTKFVFVTGGVVSSLGKGIASASLAAILESRGLKVTLIKLDPYINVDPGTMSPFQHGEVFVTDDGAETDLDLGHYERFVTTRMAQGQQLHHRQDLPVRAGKRAPRRLPGQDRAGHPAHHQRNPGIHQARRALRPAGRGRRGHRRNRRHRGRHRVAALPGSGAADEPAHGRQQHRLRAPDLRALDRRRRRAQDQAHPAHGQGTARHRYPAPTPCCAAPTARFPTTSAPRSRCSPTCPNGA